jgi:hypothetical protein
MSKSTTKAETTTTEPKGVDGTGEQTSQQGETFTPPALSPKTPDPSGSKRVKYTGPSVHTRILKDADFKRAGLEGVGIQRWSLENNHTVDLSDAPEGTVKFLTESDALKGEFKLLEPGEL